MSQLRTRLALTLAAGALVLSGCSSSRDTVAWESNGTPCLQDPLTQEWSYQFVYYPKAQVYFQPFNDTFWWYDQNCWWEGSTLPTWITIEETPTVISLPTNQPFERHWAMAGTYNHTLLPGSADARYACGLYVRTTVNDGASMMATTGETGHGSTAASTNDANDLTLSSNGNSSSTMNDSTMSGSTNSSSAMASSTSSTSNATTESGSSNETSGTEASGIDTGSAFSSASTDNSNE